jgi:hypothetical protein
VTTELKVPKNLWSARDDAIDYAHSGGPVPATLKELEQWFSEDFDVYEDLHSDEVHAEINFIFQAVPGALGEACESELRAELGISEGEPVTDAMRIEFTRSALADQWSTGSDVFVGYRHRWIEKCDGTRCLIGFIDELRGQAGIHCAWNGVFPDEAAWNAYLAQKGYLEIADIDDVPDDALLRIFDKNC